MCNICCEDYNKSTRKKVICAKCEEEACVKCVKYYILHTNEDPHCMYCKGIWTKKFLIENTTKTFVNTEYKKHRSEFLVDREISKIPVIIHLIEHRIKKNKILNKKKKLQSKILEIKWEMKRMNDELRETERELFSHDRKVLEETPKQYHVKCPIFECEGLLNDNWKCLLCNSDICRHCNSIKQTSHECKKEDVETFKYIKSQTKSCPKCYIRISKISGCSQFFCTNCHAQFDWNTGRIITNEFFHNPHYFEWINTGALINNDNDIDLECGRITWYSFSHNFKYNDRIIISEWIRLINHIDYQLRKYVLQDFHTEYLIQYAIKDISRDKYKHSLQLSEVKKEKYDVYHDIFENFQLGATNIIRSNATNVPKMLLILEQLRKISNIGFGHISRLYNCTSPSIKKSLEIKSKKYKK